MLGLAEWLLIHQVLAHSFEGIGLQHPHALDFDRFIGIVFGNNQGALVCLERT